MKSYHFVAVFFAALLYLPVAAHAVIISVVPNVLSAEQGNPVNVDITVSDLGNGTAPSVGVFDIDFSYDASILGFNTATFGNQLDLFGFGSLQLVDSSVAGTINLFELSFDFSSDLDTLQSSSFVLASLAFDTLSAGSTNLNVALNALGDSVGNTLSPNIVNSQLIVTDMPLSSPATIWLFFLGMIALVSLTARKQAV
ncbi:MAG: hypothetical protein KDD46_08590 [Bdellovibrionales bacterium]|nr:hypothetical protein [Bdellovibrionales bacterium]